MSTDDMNRWVSQLAVLWLDHRMRGEPLPFPVQCEAKVIGCGQVLEALFEFCGKNQDAVQKLIASPGQTCICTRGALSIPLRAFPAEPTALPWEVAG
jgi:hypothetical protein